MSFTSTPIAGGTTGTLADAAPAIDRIASVDYQRVKHANPNADQTGAYGIETDPVRSKNVRRGTSDYDSGLVTVANGAPSSVTSATIYPEGGVLANTSTEVREITITNTADAVIGIMTLPPKEMKSIPVPTSGAWVGLKVGADGTGVVCQVAGRQ